MSDDQGATHVVADGDTILSIAHDRGFRAWETIWDHAKNAELKKKRKDPNILCRGDQVFIPPKEKKQEAAQTEKLNPYWVRRLQARIRFVLVDESGLPVAGTLYQLKVEDKTFEGRTGDDGVVDHPIHPKSRNGEITVWWKEDDPRTRVTFPVSIGGLDPHDTISGVQARLNQLNFPAGPVTGEMNERTSEALAAFQDSVHLDPTGEPDEETMRLLEVLHDAE
jgi:putative peptidoglycan binding protein